MAYITLAHTMSPNPHRPDVVEWQIHDSYERATYWFDRWAETFDNVFIREVSKDVLACARSGTVTGRNEVTT